MHEHTTNRHQRSGTDGPCRGPRFEPAAPRTRVPGFTRRAPAFTSLILACAGLACGGSGANTGGGDAAGSGAETGGGSAIPADELVRTANPFARGYTEEDFPRLRELADGVYSYEALRSAGDQRFTTVSMFVVTDEGVLVADGQGSVAETRRLIDHIASVTDRPITHVVICSDHGDHTAGNSAFPADAEFIAHPTSARALEATAANPDRPADAPSVVLPTRLVDDRAVLELGGRTIEVLFLGRAHTGGDLVVHLPEEDILFMSEAYLHRVFPAMRTAYPTEWVAMIERAQAMEVETYVPGHGFVDSPEVLGEELEVFRQAVVQVIEEARRLHGQGLGLEEAQAAADFGELGDWWLSESQASRAIQQVYAELDGMLAPVEGGAGDADESREGGDEHGRGAEDEGEEGGEHGEEGEHNDEGEESGEYIAAGETWDETRRGARLILSFDATRDAFVGTVENVTQELLCAVRVEIHLSTGTELGPTARTDLAPGESVDVVLSAEGEPFGAWTAHPEVSTCAGRQKTSARRVTPGGHRHRLTGRR